MPRDIKITLEAKNYYEGEQSTPANIRVPIQIFYDSFYYDCMNIRERISNDSQFVQVNRRRLPFELPNILSAINFRVSDTCREDILASIVSYSQSMKHDYYLAIKIEDYMEANDAHTRLMIKCFEGHVCEETECIYTIADEVGNDGRTTNLDVAESDEGEEEEYHKPVPASNSDIERLQKVRLDNLEWVEECVVCTDKFEVGKQLTRLPCSHIYHGDCIVKWLEKSNMCPVCRKPLSRQEDGPANC